MTYIPQALKDFPNQAVASGSVAATTLYNPQVTGLYRIAVYVSPMTAASLVGSVTITIGWTDGGIARAWTSSALSLLTLGGIIQTIFPVRCDAMTSITYAISVTGSTGTYTASFGVRPPN